MNYQKLLLDNLALIDLLVSITSRRQHLSVDESQDFGGYVKLKLIEDNYAVLRKFKHRSSLWTYLAMVIERAGLDYCAQQWGRWRPSAAAERLGPVAVVMDRLIHRDGHSVHEAIGLVKAEHGSTLTERQLRDICEQLPKRQRQLQVAQDAADDVPGVTSSEALVEEAERRSRLADLQRALENAFGQLASRDRVAIAFRYDQNLPITTIATMTGLSVPTLHRRIQNGLQQLRSSLLQAGFGPRDLAELIGHPEIGLSALLRKEIESFSGPVRLSKRDG